MANNFQQKQAVEKPLSLSDRNKIRDSEICRRFKDGEPMTVLSEEYHCTRQRIQQILKINNLGRSQGGSLRRKKDEMVKYQYLAERCVEEGLTLQQLMGISALGASKIRAILDYHKVPRGFPKMNQEETGIPPHAEKHCQKVWGCDFETWRQLRNMNESYAKSPIGRYSQFRNNMKRLYPEVQWKVTLLDWWEVWTASGQYQRIGTGKDNYCLTRRNLNQDFTRENLEVISVSKLFSNRNGRNKF